MTETHAVRWTVYNPLTGWFPRQTRWHITEDASKTLCGRRIPVGTKYSFLPETDDDLSKVRCEICKKKIAKLDGKK